MEEQIKTLTEQGLAAYKKKDYLAASDAFRQCISLLDEQNELLQAAEMRNNLCVVLLELKNAEEALTHVQGTDLVFAEAGNKERQAMALGNIAAALQTLGKNEEALSKYEESAALFKEIGEKNMRAITLKKISDLQLKTGKQYQALASLNASYDQQGKTTLKDKVLKGFLGSVIHKLTRQG